MRHDLIEGRRLTTIEAIKVVVWNVSCENISRPIYISDDSWLPRGARKRGYTSLECDFDRSVTHLFGRKAESGQLTKSVKCVKSLGTVGEDWIKGSERINTVEQIPM